MLLGVCPCFSVYVSMIEHSEFRQTIFTKFLMNVIHLPLDTTSLSMSGREDETVKTVYFSYSTLAHRGAEF
jgi:hypothetical protein